MNKFVSAFGGSLIGILLLIVILFSSVEIIAFNILYYNWHYNHYNIMEITNIEQDDLIYITREMFKYLKGQRDDLDIQVEINDKKQEVFGTREKLHMVDVQYLFLGGRFIRNFILILTFIILSGIYLFFKEWMARMLRWVRLTIICFVSIMIAIGIIISTNFNYFFTVFHEIFFNNDLWILNPQKDILIQLVPLQFFINTSILIMSLFLVFCLFFVVSLKILYRHINTNST
ncbi:MAG: TIGR01906 family membrane protein [bacterium]